MAAIRIKIGTRKSVMALAQTEEIARRLTAAVPGLEVEIVKFETTGDSDQTSKLLQHGGKGGAFVAVLQQLAGLIGIARGLELDDLNLETGDGRGQPPCNFLGLGQRHHALARADLDANCRHSLSLRHAGPRQTSGRYIRPAYAGMQTGSGRPPLLP